MQFYHTPVLLSSAISGLNVQPGGTYVDATLGGGGHAAEILSMLDCGSLIGIDRDADAILAAENLVRDYPNFTPVHGNFLNISKILHSKGISGVDGILMDLGVSSHQLDTPQRGFSHTRDGPLDMRMDASAGLTAFDVVNTYPEAELSRILQHFGDERKHRRIARAICKARESEKIYTTTQLSDIIINNIRHRHGPHPATLTFMALRIYINNEIGGLARAIFDATDMLKPGGRLCMIAFHSLEDRIIKHTFRELATECFCPPDFPVCVCATIPKLSVITPRPIRPTTEEIFNNHRASSAKLRIAERRSYEQ